MVMTQGSQQPEIVQDIINELKGGKLINRTLPAKGKLKIERHLPFLLIYRYRRNPARQTFRLVMGESSYFITSGEGEPETTKALLKSIAGVLSASFGAVMFLEIWEGEADGNHFKIKTAKGIAPRTVEVFYDELNL